MRERAKCLWTWLVPLVASATAPAAPPEALAIALADARAVCADDKDVAAHTRYLDLTHLDSREREFYARLLTFHVNCLSREAVLVPPRRVAGGSLLAIDLRDYGIKAQIWERLIFREPYYHQIKDYGDKGKRIMPADHIPEANAFELYKICGDSGVPIVAGDWFFVQTCIEADRGGIGKGFGYYDFLEIKNRGDYFKLIGFNEKDFRSVIGEIGAVVLARNSGVAQNDRMAVRQPANDGFAWYTLDFFDNNRDNQNPLALLDRSKGLKHQAERHFGRLPNGLPVVIACDDKGVLQETAPDKIGPDKTANGNDARIHAAKSCFSCHNNGFLKDIDDEVRKIFTANRKEGYNLLASPVKEESLKLNRIYLRDYRRHIASDRAAYRQAVADCVGGPQNPGDDIVRDIADDYRNGYEKYVLRSVGAAEIAAGVGIDLPTFTAKLKAYRSGDKLATSIVAGLSVGLPMTRTNYEQAFPLLMQITRGVYR